VQDINAKDGILKLKQLNRPLFKGKAPTGEGAGSWFDTIVPVERDDIIETIFHGIKRPEVPSIVSFRQACVGSSHRPGAGARGIMLTLTVVHRPQLPAAPRKAGARRDDLPAWSSPTISGLEWWVKADSVVAGGPVEV